jgi:integrase
MGHVKDRWYATSAGKKIATARHGRGLRWQVWYRVEGQDKCGGSFRTKALAERKLVELEARVHRGQWVDPTDRTTVAEYARRWAASRPHRPTTAARVNRNITRQIEGTSLGARRLAAVRPSDVQAWVAGLTASGLAPSTVRLAVRLLGSIYTAAVFDHLVPTSPVARIALPRAHVQRIVPLTVSQVRALAEAMPARNRAMVFAQAGLGLRVGELLALRVQDVDFLRRTVRVEHQLERHTRARVEPKTPRSRRTIPLPVMVANELAAHISDFPPGPDGSLFTGVNGRPYDHAVYGTRIFGQVAAKLAGVKGSTFPAGTTTHDLRHHYASILLAAGESVVAVAERLGHETAALVLSTYGHLLPDSEDRTRCAVDDAWMTPGRTSGETVTAHGRPG